MQSVYLMLAQPEHIQFTDLGMAIIYCFSFFFLVLCVAFINLFFMAVANKINVFHFQCIAAYKCFRR